MKISIDWTYLWWKNYDNFPHEISKHKQNHVFFFVTTRIFPYSLERATAAITFLLESLYAFSSFSFSSPSHYSSFFWELEDPFTKKKKIYFLRTQRKGTKNRNQSFCRKKFLGIKKLIQIILPRQKRRKSNLGKIL